MTSYKRIGALKTGNNILRFLSDRKHPVSGKEISLALNIKYDTAMCYLATLEDIGNVRQVGECFELGMNMAMFWAKIKSKKETEKQNINRELEMLETGVGFNGG